MPHLTEAPILGPDGSNREQVLFAIAAMVLGRSCVVDHVDVRITERLPDGTTDVIVLSGHDLTGRLDAQIVAPA